MHISKHTKIIDSAVFALIFFTYFPESQFRKIFYLFKQILS
jgi:hypothetical protein